MQAVYLTVLFAYKLHLLQTLVGMFKMDFGDFLHTNLSVVASL